MKKTVYAALFFAAFGMTACGGNEATEEVAAEETQPQEEVVVEEAQYTLNAESTKLEWKGFWVKGGENGDSHYGTVDITEGELTQKGDHYAGNFVIDMSTIQSEDLVESPEQKAKLEGHLQAEDIFNVGNFATVNVTLNSISEGKADLTIDALGKKSNQELAVEVMEENNQLMIHGDFTLDFSSYEIPMMQMNEKDGNINPEISFQLHLVLDKK